MKIEDSIRINVKTEGDPLSITLDELSLKKLYCNYRDEILQLIRSCAEENYNKDYTMKALRIFAREGYKKATEYLLSDMSHSHKIRIMLDRDISVDTLIIGTNKHCYRIGEHRHRNGHHIRNLTSQLPECRYKYRAPLGFYTSTYEGIQKILSMNKEEKEFLYKACMSISSLSNVIIRDKTKKTFIKLLEKSKEFLKEGREFLNKGEKENQKREKARKRREENYSKIGDSINREGYYETPHGYILPRYKTLGGGVYFFSHNGYAYIYESLDIGNWEYRNKLYTLSRGKTPTKGRQITPDSEAIEKLRKIDNGLAVKIKLVSSGSQ